MSYRMNYFYSCLEPNLLKYFLFSLFVLVFIYAICIFNLVQDFKIQNIVGSCDVKFPIRLEGLAYSHGAFSSVSSNRSSSWSVCVLYGVVFYVLVEFWRCTFSFGISISILPLLFVSQAFSC